MALMKDFRSNTSLGNPVGFAGASDVTKEVMLVQEKVFQNPVILQLILKHLLQDRESTNENMKQTLCIQNAKKLRLVSKAWLFETNLLFRKFGQPLIFLTAENLHQFLATTFKETNSLAPPLNLSLSLDRFSFNCVSLPRRITQIEMSSRLGIPALILRRSEILGEMRVLKLITTKGLLDEEDAAIFSTCLTQGTLSLEELELGIDLNLLLENKDVQLQVALNFPRMTNLKKMTIHGRTWRLDQNRMEYGLGGRLPNLEELEFKLVSGDIFLGEWCRNSVFWNVRSLKLMLLNNFGNPVVLGVQFSKENMQLIIRAFPQVVDLRLGLIDAPELDGLKYIFGHMGQLTSLQLIMRGAISSEDEIAGLFIGAGPEMVRRLKADSALWGQFLDGDLGEEGTNSIRDLKSLKILALYGNIVRNTGQGPPEVLKGLPSDLAFELGFMQLPALDELILEDSFGMSEEMADKWQGKEVGFDKEPVTSWWIPYGASTFSNWVYFLSVLCIFLVNLIQGKYTWLWRGNYVWTDKLVEIAGKLVISYFVWLFMEKVFPSIQNVGRRYFNLFN